MEKLESNAGETPLDDVPGLIPLHITSRKELYEAEFLNITKATKHYLFNPSRLKITRSSLFEVHKKMFNEVWNWAGEKRKSNKNIGVPYHKIDEEIHKFLGDFNTWEKENFEIIEIVARTHHRLVWIHPFEGGNGRWSRLITNIIYYKKTNNLFKWPEKDIYLKKKSSFREQCLNALKKADKNQFNELIKIHKDLLI